MRAAALLSMMPLSLRGSAYIPMRGPWRHAQQRHHQRGH
jgi:hypothetical protein